MKIYRLHVKPSSLRVVPEHAADPVGAVPPSNGDRREESGRIGEFERLDAVIRVTGPRLGAKTPKT